MARLWGETAMDDNAAAAILNCAGAVVTPW
jgi:hypothetical protein